MARRSRYGACTGGLIIPLRVRDWLWLLHGACALLLGVVYAAREGFLEAHGQLHYRRRVALCWPPALHD